MIKKDDRLRPSVPGRTLGSSAPNERQGVDRDRGSAADLRRDAVGHIPRRRPASQPRDRSANRNKLRRTTGDADDIVFATLAEADSLIGQAAAAVFDVREEVERERLATTGAVRFRKGRFQIDLITASLPFEEMAYERASRHELFGIPLPFPSP